MSKRAPTDVSLNPVPRGATGFELARPDEPGAPNIASALARNRAFAAAGGHEGAVVFPNLRLFVITCLDPRVDPAHFLGLQLSDAMVVRNVGGRVTQEVINDVAYIAQIAENVLDGPLFEVAVIHHTQCGAGALADDTFRRRYAQRIGANEADLREHAILDPAATVTSDVERLRSAPAISRRVTFSGHVYDVVTGLVQTILPARPKDNESAPRPTTTHVPAWRRDQCGSAATRGEQARVSCETADHTTAGPFVAGFEDAGCTVSRGTGSRRT